MIVLWMMALVLAVAYYRIPGAAKMLCPVRDLMAQYGWGAAFLSMVFYCGALPGLFFLFVRGIRPPRPWMTCALQGFWGGVMGSICNAGGGGCPDAVREDGRGSIRLDRSLRFPRDGGLLLLGRAGLLLAPDASGVAAAVLPAAGSAQSSAELVRGHPREPCDLCISAAVQNPHSRPDQCLLDADVPADRNEDWGQWVFLHSRIVIPVIFLKRVFR